MATTPISGEAAPVTRPTTFPPAAAGHIAAKLLNRHSPHEIAEAIEVLVDVLDCLGGDPEAEDATDLEDDHSLSPLALQYADPGPGCAIADEDVYAMLQRNLLYTGVTRGKKLVILVGQPKAVAIAVKNESGRRRWSKLNEWLAPHPEARRMADISR